MLYTLKIIDGNGEDIVDVSGPADVCPPENRSGQEVLRIQEELVHAIRRDGSIIYPLTVHYTEAPA